MTEPTQDNPPAPGTPPPRIGSYRLIEQLGSGGMSNVYRAMHVDTGVEVAIKVLPRSLARNSTLLQRFLREAKSAEALQHPHIVPIYDRGTEGGRYYIVLEYLPDGDLYEYVRNHGPLPVHEAVELIKAVGQGLHHAARQGLIHRDVKPANLLLTRDGNVKITDLGLALQVVADDERVTRDGTTVGTVDYMSPEQARDSRSTTIRSDIYSLGCTFYYLITGEPPFPGGDVPEKLRRHAYDPVPDVRDLRPEVSEELAQLIQRMMAKKPERRFVDYDHLLKAMEELPIAPPGQVLEALIDDEGESSEDRPPPTPKPARKTDPIAPIWYDDLLNPAPPTDEWPTFSDSMHPLEALIDDDGDRPTTAGEKSSGTHGLADDSGGFALGPAPTGGNGERPPSTQSCPTVPESPGGHVITTLPGRPSEFRKASPADPPRDVNIAALAGVEETGRTIERPRPPEALPPLDQRDDSNEMSPELSSSTSTPAPLVPIVPASVVQEILQPEQAGPEFPAITLTHVLQATLVLLVLVIGIIAIRHALPVIPILTDKVAGTIGKKPQPKTQEPDEPGNGPLSIPRGRTDRNGVRANDTAVSRITQWNEPADLAPREPLAPNYDATVLQSLWLSSVVEPPADRILNPTVQVRRAVLSDSRDQLDSLRKALDQLAGTIVIEDDGPFFEEDLRINGASRIVRAGRGFRPILVIEAPTMQSVRSRPALVVLEGKRLVVEGIDFVVRASDLTPQQSALFLCRGSELVLRDCTITVKGPVERPLAIVQVGISPQADAHGPSRVRFERTLVRADGLGAVRLAEGSAQVEIVESAFLLGAAPVFEASGGPKSDRTLALVDSLMVSSGPLLEIAGTAASPAADSVKVRALRSAFLRLPWSEATGLICQREAAGGENLATAAVDWKGAQNQFACWPATATSSSRRKVLIANLDELRSRFPDTELDSRATEQAVTRELLASWVEKPESLSNDSQFIAVLTRLAAPSPRGLEWSLGAFEPLVEPSAEALASSPKPPLEFDADDSTWSGDLGRFLSRMVPSESRGVRVRVRGSGRKWMTPIRMREGVSLEIDVQPPGPDGVALSWLAVEGTHADALIAVQNADLNIRGARFERDAQAAIKHVLRVDHGRLILRDTWLIAPMQIEQGGGNLIAFQTDGSRPLDDPRGGDARPICQLVNCVMICGGVALQANVGTGLIQLRNCAIGSGLASFLLTPLKVARDRFQADLTLDDCTILAERDILRLTGWTGSERGPDRPWLISSQNCVFMDGFDRRGAQSTTVLLRADPEALARRVVLWQSGGDAYGLTRFVTTSESDPRPASFPDLKRSWVDFIGASHIVNSRNARALIAMPRGRVEPAKLKPDDLALVPTTPATRIGADPSRLGLGPTKRDRPASSN